MNWLEITALGFFVIFVVEQALGAAIYVVYCRLQTAGVPAGDDTAADPEVKVILPLRGADPCLADCVRGLLSQNYANYQVHIIIDHRDDPAWRVVHDVIDELQPTNVLVSELTERSEQCSLKCSAVLMGTEDLAPSCFAVALLDGDVVPRPEWLRDLVTALTSDRVGASMGNRWYLPRLGGWGSLVRYCWNAECVVTMFLWQLPWGGSLAIKSHVVRDTDLRQRWSKAGCEDVPLASVLRRMRLRVKAVPSQMLINREECDLRGCLRFVSRQFLWVRLYQPVCWWLSQLLHLAAVGVLILAVCLTLAALFAGRLVPAAWLAGGIAFEMVGVWLLLLWLERSTIPAGESPPPRRWRMIPAIVLTQLVMPTAVWTSLTTRIVRWRGIDYRIKGPWDIRMQEYRPYRAASSTRPGADGASRDDAEHEAVSPNGRHVKSYP